MTQPFSRIFITVSTLLWACAAMAQNHGHSHHAFAKDIDTFHSLLAPIWHSASGQARSQTACAKSTELAQAAAGIQSADAKRLVAGVANLKSQCSSNPVGVHAALHEVHEAFHALIDHKPSAR